MFLFVINELIQTIFSLSQLARRGFSVMLISRSQEKLDDVAKSLGQYLAICVCVCVCVLANHSAHLCEWQSVLLILMKLGLFLALA